MSLNNDALVKYLMLTGKLHTNSVINAFFSIDRKDFVPTILEEDSYYDMPLSIGYYQTISQPQVVSFMLELLDVNEGDMVLDVGSGSGYTTALLSKLVGDVGYVYAVERVHELVDISKNNIKKYDLKNFQIMQSYKSLGLKDKLFDRILVSASAKKLPNDLLTQLKDGGKMVIPIKNSIFLIEKKGDKIFEEEFPGFTFVPLIY